MPRTLDTDLQALIDTGHREDHTAVVLTLGDGTVLRFATGQQLVGSDLFVGELKENDPLKMNLTPQQDGCTLNVQNVDMVFGRQLTAALDKLDGATAVLGLIIVNPDNGQAWFDPKMPGDIISAAIDENQVQLNFIGDIYIAQVVSETIASVFPYQTPPVASGIVASDPNDILNGPPIGPSIGVGGGRLPDDPGMGFIGVGGGGGGPIDVGGGRGFIGVGGII
jgi:hypothetical protein